VNIQEFIQNLHFETSDVILSALVGLSIGISWFYFFYYFGGIKYGMKSKSSQNSDSFRYPPISIIMAAKNAALNLEDHIHHWLNQDYPEFELVIADDCSADETGYFLVKTAEIEPRLKFVLLDPNVIKSGGKKLALTLAIKKAKHQHFVLTDSDCIPESDQWLKQMASGFANQKSLVLGVAPIQTQGNGFLSRLIQFENSFTALNYLGMAFRGKPYMGVGRNLAYTRDLYNSVGGFSEHYHIPAGDDDLFVQSVANAQNTEICFTPESMMMSKGPKNFKEYWRQKMRHLWVGKFYQSSVKNRLMWYPVAQFLFWMGIIFWFVLGSTWLWPTIALVLKLTPEWIIYFQKSKLLKMPKAAAMYPIFNLFHSFWYVIIGINAFFKRKVIW
jgi:poly-beta-1,6-N-acetyl-D-glucosamine synthase